MSVEVKSNQFHLRTANTSYIFAVYREQYPVHIYWGPRMENDVDLTYFPDEFIFSRANAFHVPLDKDNRTFLSDLQLEFSVTGGGDYRIPSFIGKYADNSTVSEFAYIGYELTKGKKKLEGLPSLYDENDAETLEITLRDEKTGLTAVMSYCVFEEYDVITRSIRYINNGKEDIHILSAMSMRVDFPGNNYKLLDLYGDWAKERNEEWQSVGHDIITIDSKRGMSSHMHNPFMVLADKDATENSGDVFGFALIYSGNFVFNAEGDSCGGTSITAGINPYNFDWDLRSGESFGTPETVLVYSDNGLNKMSNIFHRIFRDRLMNKRLRSCDRPIIINNWDGTAYDFDEKKILDIMHVGAEAGFEMFVLDDGWFGKRDDDEHSLGDWTVNKDKLPGGLEKIASETNKAGMKFGLWFEPEMVNPDSDLYRSHPDWCIHAEGRKRTLNRHQLVLDLARADVREYVINAVSAVLRSANIEYVKWDCNRNITETAYMSQSHKYVLGLYEILEKLTAEFPDILFESCSGGGGRFDAGMLYYMPQTWTSDNMNAMVRLRTQYGTSFAYPPVTIGAHAGDFEHGYDRENKYMNTCAMVAMSGNFGFETDLSQLSEREKAQAKSYVELYKKIRKTVQRGEFYRIESPFTSDYCSWEFVYEDKAVLFTFQTRTERNGEERRIKLTGLESNAEYECEGRKYYGEELMNLGMRIPLEVYEYDSRCYIFKKIE